MKPTASVVACHSHLPTDSKWYKTAKMVASMLDVKPIDPTTSISEGRLSALNGTKAWKSNIKDVEVKVSLVSLERVGAFGSTSFETAAGIRKLDLNGYTSTASSIPMSLDVPYNSDAEKDSGAVTDVAWGTMQLLNDVESAMCSESQGQRLKRMLSLGLTELTFDHNACGARAGATLFTQAAFHPASTLTRLSMCYCTMDVARFLPTFVDGLIESKTLKELKLSNNGLGNVATTLGAAETSSVLAKLIRKQASIQKLDLHGNDFTAVHAFAMAPAFAENQTLEVVDLSHNNLSAEAVKALASGFKGNAHVHTLKLAGNPFLEVEAAVALGELILQNHAVSTISMPHFHHFQATGESALAEAIAARAAATAGSGAPPLRLMQVAASNMQLSTMQCVRPRTEYLDREFSKDISCNNNIVEKAAKQEKGRQKQVQRLSGRKDLTGFNLIKTDWTIPSNPILERVLKAAFKSGFTPMVMPGLPNHEASDLVHAQILAAQENQMFDHPLSAEGNVHGAMLQVARKQRDCIRKLFSDEQECNLYHAWRGNPNVGARPLVSTVGLQAANARLATTSATTILDQSRMRPPIMTFKDIRIAHVGEPLAQVGKVFAAEDSRGWGAYSEETFAATADATFESYRGFTVGLKEPTGDAKYNEQREHAQRLVGVSAVQVLKASRQRPEGGFVPPEDEQPENDPLGKVGEDLIIIGDDRKPGVPFDVAAPFSGDVLAKSFPSAESKSYLIRDVEATRASTV